jgi:hypothetical protein
MANINDAFPSDFLKVEDLQGKNVTVRIESAAIEEIGKGRDKDRKIVITLVGKKKKFVCNKTNAKTIASLYGQETDDWANQLITLCPREVEFQGDMVMAIRVSLQKPAATAAAPAKVAPPPPVPVAAGSSGADEDIPF